MEVLQRPRRFEILWMWVSTGNAGLLKTWARTTSAVFSPTPGREVSSSSVSGTSSMFFAVSKMFFDFELKSPQGRMIWARRFWPNFAIFSGVVGKSCEVTLFTTLSVHWAESITATRHSKGVFHLRVGFGLG